MKKFLFNLSDWIYRKKCYFCKNSKENVSMCSKCFDEIEFNSGYSTRIILNCPVYCATTYCNNVQKLIRAIKYHNKKDLAYYQAKIMFDYWKQLNIDKTFQVIPIPLHKKREKSRKYNHMTLVANEFCKLSGYEINTGLITRIKDTKAQYKLSRKERMENLKNAFSVNKNFSTEKPILLLDDICSSGSTFENIIEELNTNGICDIICFATASAQ